MKDIEEKLPDGWASAVLADVVVNAQSGFASGKKDVPSGLRHLRMNNIGQEGELVLDLIRTVPADLGRPHHLLQMDDVVVCTTNSGKLVGKCALFEIDGAFAFSNHITRLRPIHEAMDGRFLRWLLWSTWKSGTYEEMTQSWVNQSTLPKDALLAVRIPLPSIAEQKRIVGKVEEVVARVNGARERLAKLPALLKRFRQSVLAAACSGRLTANWRDGQNGRSCAQSEAVVVEQERLALWCETMHAKAMAEGRALQGMAWKSRYQAPAAMRDTELHDLPDSWAWRSFDHFAAQFQYGPRFAEDEYVSVGGVPTIRTSDMDFRGRITLNNPPMVKVPVNAIEHFGLRSDDLIVTRTGATIGKCALFDARLGTAIASAYLIRYRLTANAADPRYLLTVLMSPWGQKELVGGTTAVAQPNVNTTTIAQIPVPTPPLVEQHEIVRRVESLFSLTDKIESRLTGATATVGKLIQSTLAKAFLGELVPSEAELAELEGREFETARALLDRIREQRQEPASRRRTGTAGVSTAASSAPATNIAVALASPKARKGHSKGIFFKRAAIASYAVDRLHARKTFGRVQLEKVLYLCEAHVGLDLEGEYGRRAAGPLDPDIYKIEGLARKHNWFEPRQRHGFGIEYRTGDKIADRCGAARTLLGKKIAEMDRLLTWFEKMTTEQAEVFATVFAAWNDFLVDRAEPTDDQIVEQVRGHWHESKERFTPKRLHVCIAWMRKHRFVPRGIGPHTHIVAP